MVIVSILKRRDPSSIIVAIFLAYGLLQLATTVTAQPVSKIMEFLGTNPEMQYSYGSDGWQSNYLAPVITFALQIIALELIARAYIFATGQSSKSAIRSKRK